MDWQTYETHESNENLKNTLVKSKKYEFDTSHPIKITQYLSETSLGSKIPSLLLKLWKNCFKEALNSLSAVKSNSPNSNSLRTKLLEYETIFESRSKIHTD